MDWNNELLEFIEEYKKNIPFYGIKKIRSTFQK